ncbi:MAG TPA: hypothetical protein VGQ04_16775 [Chitinophagaceae bacterium]|jgi:magnesium-transporting ATPase (P-type)|nr:hypothetical protein [Chitinophagaceae bacterium]
MNQEQNIEQQLWAYIDGVSTNEERSVVEKLLQSNFEWKNKYRELLEVHQLMSSSEVEQPSMRFTKNVMEKIAQYHIAPATKNYINKKIIWGIAGFFITLIAVFVVYGFAQVEWTSPDNSNLPIDFSQLSKVDYSKIFSNNFVNVFMMVNVLLVLVLFDRVLANKRKQFQKQA